MNRAATTLCIGCGVPVYIRFRRCGRCANTPPNLTVAGRRRLEEEARGR